MKQANFTAYAFTAILSVLAAYVIGFGQTLDSFTFTLDDAQYEAAGLSKLTEVELSHLFTYIESIPRISYLEESSAHALRKKGWKVAQVYGIQKLKTDGSRDEDEYLVCVFDQHVQILDLPLFADRLSPGFYRAELSGTTLSILHPDGEEERYWIKETRE